MIVAVPVVFATGVSVSVRLAPPLDMTSPRSGTTAWFDDTAVTVSAVAAVSSSPMVNGISALVLAGTCWSAMFEIVGGAVTVTVNVARTCWCRRRCR